MSVQKCTGERMGVGTAKQCNVKTRRRWKRAYGSRILLLKGGCEIRRRNGERKKMAAKGIRNREETQKRIIIIITIRGVERGEVHVERNRPKKQNNGFNF